MVESSIRSLFIISLCLEGILVFGQSSRDLTPNTNLTTLLGTTKTTSINIAPVGLLPMVINTWNFTAANKLAWRILNKTRGGLRQTRNAVVEGCTKCESLQCDGTVGYGGSPDELGETTLDAMLMDGSTMNIGAVAGLRRIKQAIRVARSVLEHTQHTMLVGDAATEFAISMGFRAESLTTAASKEMWEQWMSHSCQPNFWTNVYPDPKTYCGPYIPKSSPLTHSKEDRIRSMYSIGVHNHDTIGMIAIDVESNIHAGTSTNGARHKIPGRVGDSPIPGAGSYADNEVGAAVATGDGDIMMRFLPSFLAVEAMRRGKKPADAAQVGIERILKYHKDFSGAVIAVDRLGHYGAACYGMEEFPFVISNALPMSRTRTEKVKCIMPIADVDIVALNSTTKP